MTKKERSPAGLTARGFKDSELPKTTKSGSGSQTVTIFNSRRLKSREGGDHRDGEGKISAETIMERLEQSETPDWVLELVKQGPISGVEGGCHRWVYRTAKAIHYYRRQHKLTGEHIFAVLRRGADDYERPVPDSEIQDAISSAIRHLEDPDYQTANAEKAWPDPDFERVHEIATAGFGFRDLQVASPVNLSSEPVTSDQVVSHLFSYKTGINDPLICAAEDETTSVTKPLSQWLQGESWLNGKLSQQSFLVPNRMTKPKGINQKGELSARCLDNTGPRDYLVIECDISKFDRNKMPTRWKPLIEKWEERGLTVADASAAILWHLHQFVPLVLAVHSGGKSIHGWFPVHGVEEDRLRPFMQHAVMLGADSATWTRCQFVRMPGGTRENGKRQKIHYYDPETIGKRWEVAI